MTKERLIDLMQETLIADNTGKLIEDAINLKTGNLKQQNNHLQALIVQWWNKTNKDPKFAEHFGITTK